MTLSEILKENAGSVYRIIEGLIRLLSMNKGHLSYPPKLQGHDVDMIHLWMGGA